MQFKLRPNLSIKAAKAAFFMPVLHVADIGAVIQGICIAVLFLLPYKFRSLKLMLHMPQPTKPAIAIILVNLGTPDAPTAPAVRRYLRQFLSDPRVIEIPALLWAVILNLFVLPLRPKRVAKAYASIWQDDSPMRSILKQQCVLLQRQLLDQFPGLDVQVVPAMTYGQPGLPATLSGLMAQQVEQLVVLPMFPQYSATSTGAVYDALTAWLRQQRNLPAFSILKDYHAHSQYIQALADSVRAYQQQHGVPDKLLMSFHGIPQPYADKGDPYAVQCRNTARLLAQALGLTDVQWAISFQSRFGRQEWVKPYTSELLQDWAKQGVQHVQVISPAFSADCLETLEELAVENKHLFLAAGGQRYDYIPALNSNPAHIALLANLVQPFISAFATIAAGKSAS